MAKLNLRFIGKLIPALLAGVEEAAHAMRKDSEGGKKITKEEGEAIVQAIAAKLRPVVLEELGAED